MRYFNTDRCHAILDSGALSFSSFLYLFVLDILLNLPGSDGSHAPIILRILPQTPTGDPPYDLACCS
jgi:hypothetical protein